MRANSITKSFPHIFTSQLFRINLEKGRTNTYLSPHDLNNLKSAWVSLVWTSMAKLEWNVNFCAYEISSLTCLTSDLTLTDDWSWRCLLPTNNGCSFLKSSKLTCSLSGPLSSKSAVITPCIIPIKQNPSSIIDLFMVILNHACLCCEDKMFVFYNLLIEEWVITNDDVRVCGHTNRYPLYTIIICKSYQGL